MKVELARKLNAFRGVHHYKLAHSAFHIPTYANIGGTGVHCASPKDAERKGSVATGASLLHPLFYLRRLVVSAAHSLVLGVVRVSNDRDVLLDIDCACSYSIDGLAITFSSRSFGLP